MLTSDYIVGLVDGEGSFYVNINKNQRRRAKIELKFSVKLQESDKAILEELKQFFTCGNVYFQKDTRPNHSHCYRFEVFRQNDLFEIIIPFFEKYPLKFNSKRRDFESFKQIAHLVKEHSDDVELIQSLKQSMHSGLAVYGKAVRAVGNQVTQQ